MDVDAVSNEGDISPIIEHAKDFLMLAMEAEGTNRAEAEIDLRFRGGEQWDAAAQNSRMLEQRPCLTINKVDAYVRQVTNAQRQQRPRIKVDPVSSDATVKIAQVIQGMTRHIEVISDADQAYDTGFDSAVTIGWGYWRIVTDYCAPDSFDQEIFIQQIRNPFTVYFDPASTLPDGSDAERCMITDMMTKASFRKYYPSADDGANFVSSGNGDDTNQWLTKDQIRVAEYFWTEKTREKLILLTNKQTLWEDEYDEDAQKRLFDAGILPIDERISFRRRIKWAKMTQMEVLEQREWPGRYIPVVPVYGNTLVINGVVKRFGLVRYAKDPAKMYNYWRTAMTESVALAPKAKWLLVEGQDEGHESEWAQANVSARATLRYKMTDINGHPVQTPPIRLQPEPPPAGIMESASAISGDLQAVLGVVDPAMKIQGNVSGKALQSERRQADDSNFHFYDNLTRSIRQTGKIILDLVPKVYDTERVMRIIGDDGKADLVTINGVNEVANVLENNVTIGQYDVVMDTGPGLNTKRQEAIDALMPLMGANENLFKVAGDLVFRNMDFPGAEIIADRLAAANPLAQIDDHSDIPPKIQMMIKQLQAQLQKSQQQIAAQQLEIKTRHDIVQMREDGETRRELMRTTAKAHDIEMRDKTKLHEIQTEERTREHDAVLKSKTVMSVEELRGHVALLLARIDATTSGEARSDSIDRAV